jgi:hypothetical protein
MFLPGLISNRDVLRSPPRGGVVLEKLASPGALSSGDLENPAPFAQINRHTFARII